MRADHERADSELELTSCPECGEVAEIVWRADLASTEGPAGHAYVRCVRRHWFLMPSDNLAVPPPPSAEEPASALDTPYQR